MSGNARGPSTAFCILHALFVMKLTPRQVRTLLQHPDSPYIRAVRPAAPVRAPARLDGRALAAGVPAQVHEP